MKDWDKVYEVVKNYCNKRLSKRAALYSLNISYRQLDRYIHLYKHVGRKGFKSKNIGNIPSNKTSINIQNKIIKLWDETYKSWSIHHFNVELNECYDIHISDMTLKRILYRNLRVSRFATKETKRKIKRLIEESINKKNVTAEVISQIDEELPILTKTEQHSRLAQPQYFGIEVQMDASEIVWFGDKKTTLHVAIDRKQGLFLSGWFDKQETLEGYYFLSKDLFTRYGKPARIVTDNRGVFTNLCVPLDQRNIKLTNYGFAVKTLGIELITTSIAQKKGSVERAQRTLQGWLPGELAKLNIKSIEEANKAIPILFNKLNKYTKKHLTKGLNAFTELLPEEDLNMILCYRFIRTGDNGNCINFNNSYYQLYNKGKIVPIKGFKVLFMKTLDGKFFGNVCGQSFPAVEGLSIWDKNKGKRIYPEGYKNIGTWSPPDTHPFKLKSYEQYVNNIKIRNIVFDQSSI